jgi:hypothetical protein
MALCYNLKWKGYPESENTREAESKLTCLNLLTAYWQSQSSSIPKFHLPPAPPTPVPLPLPPFEPFATHSTDVANWYFAAPDPENSGEAR